MRIVITGSIPSKKNNKKIVYNPRTKRRFVVSSDSYNQWHKDALWQLKGIQRVQTYPISITMGFYFKSQQRKDLSNAAESVLDTLVDARIIDDDDWKHINQIHLLFKGVDKANPHVEIDMLPLE